MALTTIPELNLANKITILRILLVPVFVACLIYGWTLTAILVFAASGASDSLDGIIARRRKEGTRLGAIMDPLADKFLITAAYVTVTLLGLLPPWLTIIVVSRDLIIVLGFLVLFLLVSRLPHTAPTPLGKLSTIFQIATILISLVSSFLELEFVPLRLIWYATATVTAASGLQYIYLGSRQLSSADGEVRGEGG